MAKDCCAANFERTVLRDRDVIELARGFQAFKYEMENAKEAYERYELDKKKPALMLFDAEGGFLTKNQKCMNPKDFVKVMKGAFALNAKRIKFKEKYLAQRREARAFIEDGEYRKALRELDGLMKKREYLAGPVLDLVQKDRVELEGIATDMFAKATNLREKNELIEAYKLFKEIKVEFAKLQDIGKDAGRCTRELATELRKMGITLH